MGKMVTTSSDNQEDKYMKKVLAIIAAAILFGGVAGAAVVGITYVSGIGNQINAATENTQNTTEQETSKDADNSTKSNESSVTHSVTGLDVSDIVEETMPQVVSITNTMVIREQGYSSIFDYIYGGGYTQEYESDASGSGVILKKTDDELLIVTNNHVVEDSKELAVTFIDGTTVDAAIKGTDSSIDIAVIAIPLTDIPEDTLKEIKVATLHDSEDLKPGQGVIAIGNALGYGQTVTVGYISALDREIQADNTTYSNLIQVDAAINPGNSGGALLNMDGELIGINVAKLSNTAVEGMGYSIPIYKVNQVITELSNAKTRVEVPEEDQGRLGIYMNTVSQQNVDALGIPAGVIIRGFSDEAQEGYPEEDIQESPAKDAGLMKNDIITKFDNQSVSSAEELANLVRYYEKGTTVDITVQRLENGAYTEKVVSVTLGAKQDSKAGSSDLDKSDKNRNVQPDDKNAQPDERDGRPDDRRFKPEQDAKAKDAPQESEPDESAGDNSEDNAKDNASGTDEMYDMFRQFLEQYR